MRKGRWIPLLAGVIALLVIAGIASASQASHHKRRPLAGPFCISRKTGVVRKVAPKTPCHRGEIRKVGFAVKGLRGSTGATGPQGPTGATGAQGHAGATGATGAPGLQGLPGSQGDAGQQGPIGLQGLQGTQGDQGPQGLAGVPGISSITPVSSDQTCTTGGWLIEDWQGNLYEICDGTAGPQGPQGDQGLQGPQGDQGFQGPQGPQGDTGATGPQGDVGPQGQQGNPGAAGAQGSAGPTGPQGPAGATGAQGPAGTTAIYNAGGTSQSSAHIVEGTATTNNGGNSSVTFTGSAAFTSGTSFVCTLTAENNGSPVSSGTHISSKTGGGFTFKSTLTSTTFDYVCVGN